MKAVTKIMTGAAGIAALVGMAAPAAAQYPGYPGYNTGGNVVGQVLQSILNPYGQQQYGMNPQMAVSQCSAAVQSRLAQRYGGGYNQYNPYGGGYNQYNPYANNAYSNARVLSITQVEPRSSSTLRVRGFASSGRTAAYNPYGNPYGGYGGYAGQGYNPYGGYAQGGYNNAASADLTFKCDIDYRGYIRDIDINRRY
jgi:hypothetical protein